MPDRGIGGTGSARPTSEPILRAIYRDDCTEVYFEDHLIATIRLAGAPPGFDGMAEYEFSRAARVLFEGYAALVEAFCRDECLDLIERIRNDC